MQEMPFMFYAEETPNPSCIKFVANKLLIEGGASADYDSVSQAVDAPLGQRLFQFPFVKRIFVAANFISITISDPGLWEEVRDELRVFVTDYLNKGNKLIEKLPQKEVASDSSFKETISVNTQHSSPGNDVENKIIEILEQYIRPAVQSDGGMITFKELNDGVVTVQLRGSCSGCPSSTMTLKAGIEALLKRLLPNDVKEVVSEAV